MKVSIFFFQMASNEDVFAIIEIAEGEAKLQTLNSLNQRSLAWPEK